MGFAVTAMMNHLSSLAQTFILFTTGEFGLFRLDDAYCSGSSMMPQKRNPDPLEVIKAKAAVAQGLLGSLLSIGRSLFLGYNRDTQWTKYLIIDLIDECLAGPVVMAEIIASLRLQEKEMAALCQKRFISAPDLLERIVQDGDLPFRQAKAAVERAVKYSEAEGTEKISFSALQRALREEGLRMKVDEKIVLANQEPREVVTRRKTIGGPSPLALEKNIMGLKRFQHDSRQWLLQKKTQLTLAKTRLAQMERNL